MRKSWVHSCMAVLARVLVVIMVITCFYGIPGIPIRSASAPTLTMSSQKILVGRTCNIDIVNKLRGSRYLWTSSDEQVATVSDLGLVTGKKKGNCVITCTVKTADASYKLSCSISVIKPATVMRIMNKISAINLGQEYDIQEHLAPNSTNDVVTWLSSDLTIAMPDKQGKFKAMKEGIVTISGKTLSGKTDSMTFKVIGEEGIVTTQEELNALLRSGANKITLRTSNALDFTIPRGNYTNKRLVVEAPNADIVNYGVFASIEIKAIAKNSWFENAVGNDLNVLTDSRVVVSPFSKVQMNVNDEDAELSVENFGNIEGLTVDNSSDINISGNTRQNTPVEVNTSDITLTSSIPLDLNVNEKIDLVLLDGAENTVIQAASDAVIPTIQSNTKVRVLIGKGINVVEREVIPTPIVTFTPNTGSGNGNGGSGPTSYNKTFVIDRPISEITAINASYGGKAYTISSKALDLLIKLLINDPFFMGQWKAMEDDTATYDGQTFHIKGERGSLTKVVSFTGGQFDGKSYTVTVNNNYSVSVSSNVSDIAFTISKGADDKSLTITGDYRRLSGLTFTVITGNTYILEKSYKDLKSIVVTYAGATYEVDASLLTTLDFFLMDEVRYLDVWKNTTNTIKTYAGQKVQVTGVAGSTTKIVTFQGGSLDGRSYMVTVNTDHSVTMVSNASGLSFTLNKGTDERSLTITGAPQGLIFAPSFE